MEDRCVCCGRIIPEGIMVCKICDQGGKDTMMRNGSGVPDPTPDQAMWGIRKEEKIHALEKKYGVHRGEVVTILEKEELPKRIPGKKRIRIKERKMKVFGLYPHIILLCDQKGRESFRWQEFFEKWKR